MSLYTIASSNAMTANAMFPDGSAQVSYLDNVSRRYLSKGLDLYTQKRYDEAIAALKRTVGFAPTSSQAIDAYNYMAQAYVRKGDTRSALNAYQQSLRIDSSNAATYESMGNIQYGNGNYPEAIKAYAQAAKLDPSAVNHYSLGQAYLANGQYSDAQQQFQKVRDLAPNQPNGYYGLGQVYAKQGDTAQAISSFDRALSLQSNFWNALSDKAYALVDSGNSAQAKDIAQTLTSSGDKNASSLAPSLNSYIYEKSAPQMTNVYLTGSFPMNGGGGTKVSSLGLYLNTAGASQTFSMVFQFNKQMDPTSVQNVFNWNISRALPGGLSTGYNANQPLPSTEVALPYYPSGVSYNSVDQTATVYFAVHQNAADNGTIDPSHVQFSFTGKDAVGITMDPKADQFTAIGGFV